MPADGTIDKFTDRIRKRGGRLSPSLARVITFIDANRHEVITKSALELADAIGTSDATVIRAVQAIGFNGLRELRQVLAAASGSGKTPVDTITRTFASIKEHSATAVDQVFSDHREAFAALETAETRASIVAAIEQLASAHRVGVFGMGATAFLARYLALSLNRVGRPTTVFDGYTAPLPEQLLEMRTINALIMMAYALPYREAMSTISEARRYKVPIVLITDSKDTASARHAAVVVPVECGHAGRINIHGATLVCLEAIIFALVAEDPPRTISTLERLSALRNSIYK
jgi:DNA-binding MurR/RpiR family transcriptional regulator